MSLQNQEEIIQRIKKLIRHADSAKEIGNLEEAQVFIKKVHDLLKQYNLEEDEVRAAEEKGKWGQYGYSEVISYAAGDWRLDLAYAVSDANYCTLIGDQGLKVLRVVGKQQNVETVVWLYNFLAERLTSLAEEKWQQAQNRPFKSYGYFDQVLCFDSLESLLATFSEPPTEEKFKTSFLFGAALGIHNRLKEERIRDVKDTALVALNGLQNVEYAKHLCESQGGHLGEEEKRAEIPTVNQEQYLAGMRAAQEMSLGGALDDANRKKRLE